MADDLDQASKDSWQTALNEAAYRFSVSLKELHRTNPWPENAVIDQAIKTLATELWDRCFLSHYTAGDEVRP